jgi:hypothetical protein
MLGNILVINEGKSYARSEAGPIIPEIRLHCLMRHLAGGSYLYIRTLVSIPHSTFYYIFWKTCDVINDFSELELRLPNTNTELEEASAGFEGISVHGIMRGCIGAIDRWLLLKGMVFTLRRYPIRIQQSYFTIPSIILRRL